MQRVRRNAQLWRFTAVQSSVHNLFDTDRSLSSRDTYSQAPAALAE
jgi:hypothetical protein